MLNSKTQTWLQRDMEDLQDTEHGATMLIK